MLTKTVQAVLLFALTSACQAPAAAESAPAAPSLRAQYLEIVTTDRDATCAALAAQHGVTFGAADDGLGGARTAPLAGGGRLGVREPMGANEQPLVRPYLLVDDIEAALQTWEAAGAVVAMAATEIPGQGRFAIVLHGGIQHGLWEL